MDRSNLVELLIELINVSKHDDDVNADAEEAADQIIAMFGEHHVSQGR